MCLFPRKTQHALYGQMPLIITQLNTSNLVSTATEGNIMSLFFDGFFIISIFEKLFFKMIETIKCILLCVTLEIENVGFGIFLWSCSFFREKRGRRWQGDRLIFWGMIIISNSPVISRIAKPGTCPQQLSPQRTDSCFQTFYKAQQGPINTRSSSKHMCWR